MVWNAPDGDDKDKDPWTGKSKKQGPPDLDEALKKLHKKLSKIFSNRSGSGSGSGSGGDSGKGEIPNFNFGWIFLAVFTVIWGAFGLYTVQPAERAAVLRFGEYVRMESPGIHWIPLGIESKTIVDEQKITTYAYEAQMLTKDANMVSIAVAVQYRVSNVRDFLYNVTNARESLKQATAAALRQVVGRTVLDDIMTVEREQVRIEVRELVVEILKRYKP